MADNTQHAHRDYLYDRLLQYLEIVLTSGNPGFNVTANEVDIFLDYAREKNIAEISTQSGISSEGVRSIVRRVIDGMNNVVSVDKRRKEEQTLALERRRTQIELRDAQEKARNAAASENNKKDAASSASKRKAYTPKGIVDTHARYKDMSRFGPNLHETFNMTNQTGKEINEGRKTIINGRLVDLDDIDDWRDRD